MPGFCFLMRNPSWVPRRVGGCTRLIHPSQARAAVPSFFDDTVAVCLRRQTDRQTDQDAALFASPAGYAIYTIYLLHLEPICRPCCEPYIHRYCVPQSVFCGLLFGVRLFPPCPTAQREPGRPTSARGKDRCAEGRAGGRKEKRAWRRRSCATTRAARPPPIQAAAAVVVARGGGGASRPCPCSRRLFPRRPSRPLPQKGLKRRRSRNPPPGHGGRHRLAQRVPLVPGRPIPRRRRRRLRGRHARYAPRFLR